MQLNTEIEIDAPPERVWRVLTEFEAYEQWNPFITRIAGALKPGELLQVTMSLPEGPELSYAPEVTRVAANRELSWKRRVWHRSLLEREHYMRLVALAEQRTRFVQGERISGVLLKVMGHRLTLTARGLVYMNQALKRRAEA
jgi:hypothetical protein